MKHINSIEEIPARMTEDEAAEFYGTHSLADVMGKLEPVAEPIELSPRLRETMLRVRLKPKEMTAVKSIARRKGMDYQALVRQWIVEKVKEYQSA